jgi:hypothetical protein
MSLKTAKEKYLLKKKINKKLFNKLKEADPSKSYKYLEAMCKFYLQNDFTEHDIPKLARYIYHWNRFRKKKYIKEDINQLNFNEFNRILTEVGMKYNDKILKTLDSHTSETVIVDNEKLKIVVPHTKYASIKHGAGTKWCTSAKNSNRFREYRNSSSVLYYVHFKDLDDFPDKPMHNDSQYKTAYLVDYEENLVELWDADDSLLYSFRFENEEKAKETLKEFNANHVEALRLIDYKNEEFIKDKYFTLSPKISFIEKLQSYYTQLVYVFNDDKTIDIFERAEEMSDIISSIYMSSFPIKIKYLFGSRSNLIVHDKEFYDNLPEFVYLKTELRFVNYMPSNTHNFSVKLPKGRVREFCIIHGNISHIDYTDLEITSKIFLKHTEIKSLKNIPLNIKALTVNYNNLKQIDLPRGNKICYLNLEDNNITKIENLNDKMDNLILANNKITKVENLPSYCVNIDLKRNPIKEISDLSKNGFEDLEIESSANFKMNGAFIRSVRLSNPRQKETEKINEEIEESIEEDLSLSGGYTTIWGKKPVYAVQNEDYEIEIIEVDENIPF